MYEIWSEGFVIQGSSGKALLEGRMEADNFREACITLLGDRLDKDRDGNYKLSIWGCRLFDNEPAARASFG